MNGILDLPADDYHADTVADVPTLSNSIAKLLCTHSPLHAWTAHPKLNPDYRRKESDRFDLGTTVHELLLLDDDSRVHIIDANDWKTKAAREERDEARAAGKLPILTSKWPDVQAMTIATRANLAMLDVDPLPFTDGKAEQTIVWEDGVVACRARLDWLRDDHLFIDDLKTTSSSASPDAFTKTIYNMGHDVQVAAYRSAVRAVTGVDPEFRFVVVETAPPYALSVVALGPAALTIAEKKWRYAVETWRRCLERDEWLGYPTRIAYAELPAWEEAAWLERELREVA